MDRKDFLASIGLSAATFAFINCAGCAKSSNAPSGDTSGPTGIDFTLDLNLPANAGLSNNGGHLVSNGVIVARTTSGSFVAAQRSCTHESYGLIYQPSASRFYCANHGATFSESGTVTNGPASRALTTYHTQLTGTSLRIYS
ncbi:(2Fe-2S)-binding protein [Pedobacter sp. PACM 27299]|uniref:QcrA and Rieske domain-containing protein n=1 Tax=Pedobacter sp. PACM 27299 TaxID=1727164 RepID=UPI000705C553|nr:Rieske 2Fe-2S domain-containing protein [Pedobacter sp. PACM 27299]ALL07025.1 (2Fe-2S)-binding protein [Pedobacter sp. PACM 27299]